jgi:hypothetical protein
MPVPDFSPGEVLTAAAMDSIGLWLVKTVTIGSTVGSVPVADAFPSDYESFKIVVTGGVSSTANFFRLALGASSTGYYMGRSGVAYATGSAATGADNNAAFWGFTGTGQTTGLSVNIELTNPNLAKWTTISGNYASVDTGVAITGVHQVATAYTGFTFTANTGTWTGGVIRVYGYRN